MKKKVLAITVVALVSVMVMAVFPAVASAAVQLKDLRSNTSIVESTEKANHVFEQVEVDQDGDDSQLGDQAGDQNNPDQVDEQDGQDTPDEQVVPPCDDGGS